MRKKVIGVALAALFLTGCNVQTVQQYDEEKEKLMNEQVVEQQPAQETVVQSTKDEKEKVETKPKTVETVPNKGEDPHKEAAVAKSVLVEKETTKTPKRSESSTATQKETTKVPSKDVSVSKKETVTQKQQKETSKKRNTVTSTKKKEEKETKQQKETTKAKRPTTPKPKEQTTSPTKTNPVVAPPKDEVVEKEAETKSYVSVSVRVDTLLKEENYELLPDGLQSEKYVPRNGAILNDVKVKIEDGDTAWTVTRKALQMNDVHVDYTGATETKYGSIYVKGIQHIYERQAGSLSGWMYAINGKAPNVGVSSYKVKKNDQISWQYTVNLGKDIGY